MNKRLDDEDCYEVFETIAVVGLILWILFLCGGCLAGIKLLGG